jgi:hypothetical protein
MVPSLRRNLLPKNFNLKTEVDAAVRLRHEIRIEQQRQAYLQPLPQITLWKPILKPLERPAELLMLPSAAAVSYDLAVNTYAEQHAWSLRLEQAQRLLHTSGIFRPTQPQVGQREVERNQAVQPPALQPKVLQSGRRNSCVDMDAVVPRPALPAIQRAQTMTSQKSRVDPHEILRRHREKRKLEQLGGSATAGSVPLPSVVQLSSTAAQAGIGNTGDKVM